MKHLGTVTLETERLILRRYVTEDAEAMFRNWVNDPEVTRYLTWQSHGSIELTRKINLSDVSKYDNISHYQWAVVLKSLNEPIGGINVVEIDEGLNSFGFAYRIGKSWWRQGFASEALKSVIKFLFEQVGANRITATYDTRNPNSGAVMRKCGMSYEGTLRQSGCNNQGIYDAACYAILAEDYFNREKPYIKSDTAFWMAIDKLVSESKVVIDRPKGTKHPRFDFIYPLDYGYLKNTSSMDGGGIDVWSGSNTNLCDAIICTVDLFKKDSEIKLLLGCTEEEKEIAMRFHNDSEYMKGVMIRRNL